MQTLSSSTLVPAHKLFFRGSKIDIDLPENRSRSGLKMNDFVVVNL